MKILIIGSNGQLGWELCRRGKPHGFNIISADIPEFDITDSAAIKKAANQPGVSLVINASAYTAVDRAESEPESAFAVNCDGPAYLAESCNEAKIPLIHISTDYVFDGTREEPYLETDSISPIGIYGKSKAEGEGRVRRHLKEHIIIRTAWLYGIHGNNFVKTMLGLGKEKETLRVVADQYGCPTCAADLAEAILTIAGQIKKRHNIPWGTYHYCGKGKTTWHGFAEKIFELAGQYDSFAIKKVIPVTTAEYPTPAGRPLNSVLDCSMLIKNFGIIPAPWQESLATMLAEYSITTISQAPLTLNIKKIKDQLIQHEGLKLKPYQCPADKLTIGIGRNLEDKGITEKEALMLLENDIHECLEDLKTIFDKFDMLPGSAQNVLVDMRFNLGHKGFRKFKNMIKAVKQQDFHSAAREMKDSLWYNQVGKRSERLTKMMEDSKEATL